MIINDKQCSYIDSSKYNCAVQQIYNYKIAV